MLICVCAQQMAFLVCIFHDSCKKLTVRTNGKISIKHQISLALGLCCCWLNFGINRPTDVVAKLHYQNFRNSLKNRSKDFQFQIYLNVWHNPLVIRFCCKFNNMWWYCAAFCMINTILGTTNIRDLLSVEFSWWKQIFIYFGTLLKNFEVLTCIR